MSAVTGRFVRGLGVCLTAVTCSFGVLACGDDGDEQAEGDPAEFTDPVVPDWIERVDPSAESGPTPERAVEVDFVEPDPAEEVRLEIDGVDVTAQALVGEPEDVNPDDLQPTLDSRLRYDPRDIDNPLVELSPGPHSATAILSDRGGFGEEAREIDSYSWEFTIQ